MALLGQRISDLCNGNHITQKQLAEKIGVSVSQLSPTLDKPDTDLFSGHGGKGRYGTKPAYRYDHGFVVRFNERLPRVPDGGKTGYTVYERKEDGRA